MKVEIWGGGQLAPFKKIKVCPPPHNENHAAHLVHGNGFTLPFPENFIRNY